MCEEKRTKYRLQMDVPVLYKVCNQQSGAIKKATTCNITSSGICFYTDSFHEKGTNLQVMLQQILDSPKTCTVVWHSEKYENRYKIGAHFLQDIF